MTLKASLPHLMIYLLILQKKTKQKQNDTWLGLSRSKSNPGVMIDHRQSSQFRVEVDGLRFHVFAV